MIEVEKLKLRCKYCKKELGTLKDIFKFGKWVGSTDSMNLQDLELLTHNHLTCHCEKGADGLLSLKLEGDEFEVIK